MRCTIPTLLFLLCSPALHPSARAGGGPMDVLVVVNDASSLSQELGHYYREKRGIPERQICHLNLTTAFTTDAASFTNEIRQPILTYIAEAGLSNQVDFIVFSRDIPYRISNEAQNVNGLTGAMLDDYKHSPPPCSLPPETFQDYFEAERAFVHDGSAGSGQYYLSTILTGDDMDEARTLVDRAVMADFTAPTGTVFYLHTADFNRNVRWPQFENADFLLRGLAAPLRGQIRDAESITGETRVMGYMVGRTFVINISSNLFLPGALGDHLTSFGGYLLDPAMQSPALDWIANGCAGSHGTTVEPCNYTNKFPQARLHYWYGRGFNLAESYFMAIQNPYQGVVIGDPLCRPYAVPPSVTVSGFSSGETIGGTVGISVTGSAATATRKVDQLDLFIDDLYVATLTNVVPRPGNRLSLAINATTNSYTVLNGDTLGDITSALETLVDLNNTNASARSTFDSLTLSHSAVGVSVTDTVYSITAQTNTASDLTVCAWTAGPRFLDAEYPARKRITLNTPLASGDVVRAVITRLDGQAFTNTATAGDGETTSSLLAKLQAAVNGDVNLQGPDGCTLKYTRPRSGNLVEGWVVANTNRADTYGIQLDYDTRDVGGTDYDGPLNDNQDVLAGRGTVFLSQGYDQLTASYSLETTNLADGPHTLRAVAYEGTALKTQGHAVIPFVVSNHAISCAITNPVWSQNFSTSAVITVDAVSGLSGGSITSLALYVEGKRLSATNTAAAAFTFDALDYGPGRLGLQAEAFADTGARCLSPRVMIRIFRDADSDSLPDWWEWEQFGSESLYGGTNDVDGDGVNNTGEYIADTLPLNGTDFFRILVIDAPPTGGVSSLSFLSSTDRLYTVETLNGNLTNGAAWSPSDPANFRGAPVATTWEDTNPATNKTRLYRVRATVP